jgi:hypothetical protein
VDQEVSRTLDDIERRLKQLEVDLAATAPSRLTEPTGNGVVPGDELARARGRVEQIAHELLRDCDELLHFRSRLEQAKGDLIEDYQRLLEARDPARPFTG